MYGISASPGGAAHILDNTQTLSHCLLKFSLCALPSLASTQPNYNWSVQEWQHQHDLTIMTKRKKGIAIMKILGSLVQSICIAWMQWSLTCIILLSIS